MDDNKTVKEYARQSVADLSPSGIDLEGEGDVRPEVAAALAVLEEKSVPEVKRKLSKPRYTQFATEALAAQGCRLMSINWKKRVIHYVEASGKKATVACFGIPKGI